MTDSYIQSAFNAVIPDAMTPTDGVWVSLYMDAPFYGGPEEGGWWGRDVSLVATKHYDFNDVALQAEGAIKDMAEQMTRRAKRSYGECCLNESAWLAARGLDDDYLPEPDGECIYFVIVEQERGSSESTGARHYE